MPAPAPPAVRPDELGHRVAANRRAARLLEVGPAAALALFGLIVGLGVAGLGGLVAGLVLGAALGWGAARWAARTADGRVLRRVGARPAGDGEALGCRNLIEGLAAEAGVLVPALRVVPTAAPNALVVGREPATATVVVTTGLLEGLNRVQLEGALAPEIAHLRAEDTRVRTLSALYRPLSGLFPDASEAADVEGAMLTRYPPGLATALGVLLPGAGPLPGGPSVGGLWLVPPGHPEAVRRRIATLEEL